MAYRSVLCRSQSNLLNIYSWLALARLEAKLGNIERAREVFRDSVIRCPNNVHILHAWGHLEQVGMPYKNSNADLCTPATYLTLKSYFRNTVMRPWRGSAGLKRWISIPSTRTCVTPSAIWRKELETLTGPELYWKLL